MATNKSMGCDTIEMNILDYVKLLGLSKIMSNIQIPFAFPCGVEKLDKKFVIGFLIFLLMDFLSNSDIKS